MIARAMVEYAANALWQIPLLAGTAWLSLWLAAAGPRTQHRVWLAVLLLAVAMPAHGVDWGSAPSPEMVAPQRQVALARDLAFAGRVEEVRGAAAPGSTVSESVADWPLANWPLRRAAELRVPMVRMPMSARYVRWFAGLYGTIVLLGAVRIGRAWLAAHGLVGRSRAIQLPEPLASVWIGYGRDAGVRLPGLRESDEIAGPVVIGIGRPVLLLPSNFLGYRETEVKAALCHELAHVVRRDYVTNLVCQVLALPVVWHPAIHAVGRRVARTREMACDAMAAEWMDSGVVYARALLALAQGMLERRERLAPAPGLGLLGNNMLEERVERLMSAMEMRVTTSVRARVARAVSGIAAMTASMVVAATFHVAPLLAQNTPAPTVAAAPEAEQTAPAGPAPAAGIQQAGGALPALPAAAPPAMQGTATPPAEPALPAPAATTLGVAAAPAITTYGKATTVIQDSGTAAAHAHRWTSADGRRYVVLNDQAAELSDLDKHRIEQQTKDAKGKADEAMGKIDKDLAIQIDTDIQMKVQKQIEASLAYLHSPEFQKQMAEARRNESAALAKLPELRAQLARLNSPEFQKQLAEATTSQTKALAELSGSQAETEQRMKEATKQLQEATRQLEAATLALREAQARIASQTKQTVK